MDRTTMQQQRKDNGYDNGNDDLNDLREGETAMLSPITNLARPVVVPSISKEQYGLGDSADRFKAFYPAFLGGQIIHNDGATTDNNISGYSSSDDCSTEPTHLLTAENGGPSTLSILHCDNGDNESYHEQTMHLIAENTKLRQDVDALVSKVNGLEEMLSAAVCRDDGEPGSNNKNGCLRSSSIFAQKDSNDETVVEETLPNDTFSFLVISHPLSAPFILSTTVFVFQVFTFILVALSVTYGADEQNNPLNAPANVEGVVRITQFIAIVIAVAIQDDIRTGLLLAHEKSNKASVQSLQSHFPGATRLKWRLSVMARIVGGTLGLLVTWLLIVTADTVLDLLLNFTAMQFVSQLDEICFFMSDQGFTGRENARVAHMIKETPYSIGSSKRKKRRKIRVLILSLIFAALIIGSIVIAYQQNRGRFVCSSIFVQFSDEFVASLGIFSGLYDRSSIRTGQYLLARRFQYVERQSGGRAVFAYCETYRFWTFRVLQQNSNDDQDNDDHNYNNDPCNNWIARSPETSTFDLTQAVASTNAWTVRNIDGREISLQHFYLSCHDCNDYDETTECSGRGTCSNAVCTCHDTHWYGLRCEFHEPCPTIQFDSRYSAFGGTSHEWANTFDLLKDSQTNEPVEVYHRPVYISEQDRNGLFDIILYTGRRWSATYSAILPIEQTRMDNNNNNDDARQALVDYLSNGFHPFWSNLTALLFSEPIDVGTPGDENTPVGVHWFSFSEPVQFTLHHHMDLMHLATDLDSLFLCEVCNDETNPCMYDGICDNTHGHCHCAMGSSGTLCQVPPVGNGHCDAYYNTLAFEYDGGDCCESTCVSSSQFTCGLDETGFRSLGYYNCHLATTTSSLSNDVVGWSMSSRNPIIGPSGSLSGYTVAISGNGRVLVIGDPSIDHVRVFDRDGSQWMPRGDTIVGPPHSFFGSSISVATGQAHIVNNPLSMAPILFVVGTGSSSTGYVFLYECHGHGCSQVNQWTPFISDYPLRIVVDISGNGNVIAAGAAPIPDTEMIVMQHAQEEEGHHYSTPLVILENDPSDIHFGHHEIVESIDDSHDEDHEEDHDEDHSEEDHEEDHNEDHDGEDHDEDHDEEDLDVGHQGAYGHHHGGGGSWTLREVDSKLFEVSEGVYSVSLSENGDVLAIGSSTVAFDFDHGLETEKDTKRVIAWNGTFWIQRGYPIVSTEPSHSLLFNLQGRSMALSDDGSVLALGLWVTDSVHVDEDGGGESHDEEDSHDEKDSHDEEDSHGEEDSHDEDDSHEDGEHVMEGEYKVGEHQEDEHEQQDVLILAWDDSLSDWVQRGSSVDCDGHREVQGWSVALSADGSIVAIGSADHSDEHIRAPPAVEVDGTVCAYHWSGDQWDRLHGNMVGGHGSSIALSADGSALAVGLPYVSIDHSGSTVVYELPSERCSDDGSKALFRLSVTTDDRPESTTWELFSNNTSREVVLSGGPYDNEELQLSTFAEETCVSKNDCLIFTIYDNLDLNSPLPADGMRPPGGYTLFLDGMEVVSGRISRAVDRVYIGANCLTCPEGTQLFRMLVQTCNYVSWDLQDQSGNELFAGDNFMDYSDHSDCSFGEDQMTYWEETCLPSLNDCFMFSLKSSPVPSIVSENPNLQYRLFLGDEQIASKSTRLLDQNTQKSVIPIGRCN